MKKNVNFLKLKSRIIVCTMAVLMYGLALWGIIKPDEAYSFSERRSLEAMPGLSVKAVVSGDFMEDFESYSLDQFPLRDSFRTLKAAGAFYLFGQQDNNGLYLVDGYASKMEYPLSMSSLDYAIECFDNVYNLYLEEMDSSVYAVIVPDKNYYLAERSGYLSMDYERLYSYMQEQLSYMQFIDIRELLDYKDFYRTDTHWRQEQLTEVAGLIGETMGADVSAEYDIQTLKHPFYGVYYGQAALPVPPEALNYLDNETINACTVYDYETGQTKGVYDMDKAEGADLYEMFLSGQKSLLVIKNPSAKSDKELIIFRDSFGSSLAPLLIEGYSKITLVDIRYISPFFLKKFITFENQDILFLYSTLVLNNSITLMK